MLLVMAKSEGLAVAALAEGGFPRGPDRADSPAPSRWWGLRVAVQPSKEGGRAGPPPCSVPGPCAEGGSGSPPRGPGGWQPSVPLSPAFPGRAQSVCAGLAAPRLLSAAPHFPSVTPHLPSDQDGQFAEPRAPGLETPDLHQSTVPLLTFELVKTLSARTFRLQTGHVRKVWTQSPKTARGGWGG